MSKEVAEAFAEAMREAFDSLAVTLEPQETTPNTQAMSADELMAAIQEDNR